MIKRLLIANRGEIAIRICRACRELGIETVAVYSEPDARSLHVLAADRAMPIGPAASAESYLSIPNLIEAARASGAEAIHPGYGFLSENAAFAASVEEAGLIFVGPPSSVIARMGSKIEARQLMQRSDVPVVPGETPADQSDEELRKTIDRVGLPVLIKASAGGGGKGMRRVDNRDEIARAIQAARHEAMAAFGDPTLYVERLIERPHHVEVQLVADGDGNVLHLFERECSTQRRHQKVLEESPSPSVTPGLRKRITDAAVLAARAASYRNAGTIEFLVDVSGGVRDVAPFYFLEMNARLQVEHCVTEQVTGVDLVRAQLAIASGESLAWTQDSLTLRGHAVEARIYAEDPARGFLPQAGRLLFYQEPRWPRVRVDSGVQQGSEVSVHYDPLLAKVIATAETRDQAISRLVSALRAYPMLGIRTNIPFLLRVLEHPRFSDGTIDTSFLDTDGAALAASAEEPPPAFVRAAVARHELAAGAAAAPSWAGWDPWTRLHGWRA